MPLHTKAFALAVFVATPLLACSGDDDDAQPLTCEFFANDNCWRRALAEASSCVPPRDDQGMFSHDLRQCTYPDGASLAFHEPAQVPQTESVLWDFDLVAEDGDLCLSFYDDTDTGGAMRLETSNGTVEVFASSRYTLRCPEGDAYRASALSLLQCENIFSNLPGHATSWGESFLTFSLVGTGDEALPVFSCER